jgi:hypothetical protein
VRPAEDDGGLRPDFRPSEERQVIKQLKRENFELPRANEILNTASVLLRPNSTQTVRSERVHR